MGLGNGACYRRPCPRAFGHLDGAAPLMGGCPSNRWKPKRNSSELQTSEVDGPFGLSRSRWYESDRVLSSLARDE
jgi:hypothetical protein